MRKSYKSERNAFSRLATHSPSKSDVLGNMLLHHTTANATSHCLRVLLPTDIQSRARNAPRHPCVCVTMSYSPDSEDEMMHGNIGFSRACSEAEHSVDTFSGLYLSIINFQSFNAKFVLGSGLNKCGNEILPPFLLSKCQSHSGHIAEMPIFCSKRRRNII